MMGGWGGGYGPMMGGWGWTGMIIGLVFLVMIVIGVILLVVWIVKAASRNGGQGAQQHVPSQMQGQQGMGMHGGMGMQGGMGTQAQRDDAMDIARRRLAAGEITADQFEEIRRALEGSGSSPVPERR